MSLGKQQPKQLSSSSHREQFIQKYGTEPWHPPNQEQWYYVDTKAPNDSLSVWKSVFYDPLLRFLKIRSAPKDPTYGRFTLPFSPHEKLIRDNKRYSCWDARVFLDNQRKAVDHPTEEWIWYQVWWDEGAAKQTGAQVDLLFCHGLGEYGGWAAFNAPKFLDAGYRLIVPDLPSHGRSTGLHAYITDFKFLADTVHQVLTDVIRHDGLAGRSQRDVVVAGQSMGGFACVSYGLLYHTPTVKPRIVSPDTIAPKLLGLVPLCPMLEIAPESRPSALIELTARVINSFAGRLPMAPAQQGKETYDPWFNDQVRSDPQTYHGKLRSATGLAILDVLDFIDPLLQELQTTFLVLHGQDDRVTNPLGSQKLFDRAQSVDKQIKVYPNTEHVMLRVGRDAEDDQGRQEILSDIIAFIERLRVKGQH